jgi:hypothetical protein
VAGVACLCHNRGFTLVLAFDVEWQIGHESQVAIPSLSRALYLVLFKKDIKCKDPPRHNCFIRRNVGGAEVNTTFLALVHEGMTREELQTNIARRPLLWERFSGWLNKLPSSNAAVLLK